MAKLFTWKVSEAPSGRYRSFQKRGWPSAHYKADRMAARIVCDEDYSLKKSKSGEHAPLKVNIADYSVTPWEWRQMKGEFATLDEAKDAFAALLIKHPKLAPKDEGQ